MRPRPNRKIRRNHHYLGKQSVGTILWRGSQYRTHRFCAAKHRPKPMLQRGRQGEPSVVEAWDHPPAKSGNPADINIEFERKKNIPNSMLISGTCPGGGPRLGGAIHDLQGKRYNRRYSLEHARGFHETPLHPLEGRPSPNRSEASDGQHNSD